MKDILNEKHCGTVTKGVFLHDNALAYHLFRGLKKQLKGYNFSSYAEVIATAETRLDGQFLILLSALQNKVQRAKN
jgi:hypothetical protein